MTDNVVAFPRKKARNTDALGNKNLDSDKLKKAVTGCKVLWHNESGTQAWVSYYPKTGFSARSEVEITRCTFPV